MKTHWLNFHLPYACRHSQVCCRSGWPIPIERPQAAHVEREVATGRVHPLKTLWLLPSDDAPNEMAGTLAVTRDQRCVFLGAGGAGGAGRAGGAGWCAIYSMRPLSCSHFPYVCLIDQRGVHVTLSHYCPTAAALLFDHDGPVEIVEGPSPVPDLEIPEGLDARESLPPPASPGKLMSLTDFSDWEREQIQGAKSASGASGACSADLRLFESARGLVPPPLSWPVAPMIEETWTALVQPAWPSFAPVINRYLSAKLFASWAAYLGDGTEAVLHQVDIAAAVLKVEAVRLCLAQSRPLDAPLLKQAIRQSDLLLLHVADREKLSEL